MGSLGTRKSKPSFLAFAAMASFVTIVTSQLNLRNLVMNLSTPSAAVGLYDIAASAGPLLSLSSFTSSSSSSSVPSQRKKYVVLSATIGVSARAEDYTYLAAVTARNWNNFGFTPIIVLVGSTDKEIQEIIELWKIILSPETRIVPVKVEKREHQIAVSQVSRLLVTSALSNIDDTLDDNDFVRLTDADMMIMNPKPFEAPYESITTNSTVSDDIITIFNGRCCPGEYPMHSVGMRVKLFRNIFPVNRQFSSPSSLKVGEVILHQFYNWTRAYFPEFYSDFNEKMTQHGGSRMWGMDQAILYARVNDAVKTHGYSLELAAGPKGRVHFFGGTPNVNQHGGTVYTPDGRSHDDAHLASFNFEKYGSWLDSFVDQSVVLFGHRRAYQEYTTMWKTHFNITSGNGDRSVINGYKVNNKVNNKVIRVTTLTQT